MGRASTQIARRRPFHHYLGPTLSSIPSLRILRKYRVTYKSRKTLSYWKRKEIDPHFHADSWGGFRWCKFDEVSTLTISLIVWSALKINPCQKVSELLGLLNSDPYVFGVKRTWLLNLFRSWNWSWKRPVFQNIVRLPF